MFILPGKGTFVSSAIFPASLAKAKIARGYYSLVKPEKADFLGNHSQHLNSILDF
jgi:hypothetical protein